MRHTILLLMVAGLMATGSLKAQHHFKATSLSEALITLDHSTERYDISFVYDELEDFTVTTDISKSSSVPDAVRQVCGFYPVKVSVKGRNIFVECIQKDRTKLTGRLMDDHNQPVAYANILLYHLSDSTVIGGGVSNEAGDFVIPCSAREAYVRVSCIGYKTMERTLPIGNVGTLRLQTANIYLGPVSVSGHAPVIRSEADRLSYIVSRDAFARELTAMELLNRIPMVSVTGGNASILGKGPAHFMLNGRMVEQDGETIRQKLWSMRAEDIERIEVISVPSGEYQTEAGGYINIVLNTAQSQGWRADLSGQYVKNDKWSSRYTVDAYSDRFNASLSYASPKVDFSLDLQSSYQTNSVETESDYKDIRLGKNCFDKHSDMRIARRYNNSGINTLLRWRPSDRLELGAMLSRQLPGFTMISEDESVWSEANKQLYYHDKLSKGEHYSNYPKRNPTLTQGLTAYADWKIDKRGKRLNLTYNYFKRKSEDETSSWVTDISKIDSSKMTGLFTTAKTKYKLHDVKLNLTMPFKSFCMDAGLAYTDISSPSDITNGPNDFTVVNTANYDYRERTAAGYLTLQSDFFDKRLSAKAGLRFERTWLEGETKTLGVYSPDDIIRSEENNRTYNELLPTLHLAWRLGHHRQLSLAYGVGINRPNLNDMNPLQFYFNKNNYMQGNPALFHGKTKSLELSYTDGRGLNATAYYHQVENQVEWITEFYNNSSDNTVLPYQMTYPINCVNYEKTGLNLRYQYQFSPQFSAMAEGEAYYYDADAFYMTDSRIINGQKYISIPTYLEVSHVIDTRYNTIVVRDNYGWGGRFALSADLFLNRKHTWMVSGRYDHWLKDYQGMTRYDGYGYFSFAVRCSLLRDRLKLSLTATDPFSQYVVNGYRTYTSEGGFTPFKSKLFDETFRTNHHITSLSLTATYSLFNRTKIHYTK